MEIRTVGVVGAGTMGHGIAQVALQNGLRVILRDVEERILQQARARIEKGFDRLMESGKFGEGQKADSMKMLTVTTNVGDLKNADFIVEAATEDFGVKKAIFQDLDKSCRPSTILASNTSSISITKIGATTRRPDKVIGMHFMNPVAILQLVEVIRGVETAADTAATTHDLAKRLGKTAVEAGDFPGFLANRILMPMINEAVFALMEGVGTVEAIDTVMHLGMKHPMGPLALADLIGLDICLAVLRVLHDGMGDPKYRPSPLLVRMVDAGHLGRKSGRGFYNYS
jgi:3-hydroxybutyryl-CoA dehydrogenase